MGFEDDEFETIFGQLLNERLLLDMPVDIEVWKAFRAAQAQPDAATTAPAPPSAPGPRLPLILSIGDAEAGAAAVARLLRTTAPESDPVHIHGFVYGDFTIADVVRHLLPMTRWHARLRQALAPDRASLTSAADDMVQRAEAGDSLHLVNSFLDRMQAPTIAMGATRAQPEAVRRISLDRTLRPAGAAFDAGADREKMMEALRTVKADASAQLFPMGLHRICWAVVDSGISSTVGIRIDRAYDFSDLVDLIRKVQRDQAGASEDFLTHMASALERRDKVKRSPQEYRTEAQDFARAQLSRLDSRRSLDWDMWEPLLSIDPATPLPIVQGRPFGHGTAVAAILAADPRQQAASDPYQGICPGLRIIDIRVTRVEGGMLAISEFCVVAALQFLRHLNRQSDEMTVHGINLSLQVPHDVRSYGCGATPVCCEADACVNAGMVVVAAAGNDGLRELRDSNAVAFRQNFAMTVNDPGNADLVITVGSTHRRDPYRYGVSFFSGRGPTADGRRKPDLLAPGEKLTVLTPSGGRRESDGTSLSAAFVSGAAAMLMARNPELIGNPRLVKQRLVDNASDLGRDRNFQGAGLLNTLRALQAH